MQLITRKFNVNEYHKMAETGILTPEDRVELIKGEIIAMSPIGRKHAATVNRLNQLLCQKFYNKVIVSVQNSIRLDNYSEPQPDIVLLKPRSDFYESKIPEPEDIYLLIEVADSTIKYDQDVKLPLYAESKISEVWIVNLNNKTLEVYRQPQNKTYVEQKKNVQSISPIAFPETTLTINDIFS
ncbi:unknown [Crocosphaera subtropica ATCC 51142]|uniref:Putative restriction endonuclease domain-containing protein n=1 Tax=Crocosphaera subtropica (strain ATCC 51142 / BH68) TaxID=43989 RepID=B1X162_CROS5|nr:Uma2 family endonuclease [Crocosphaera subtropica]ACB49703.1 unknown [Crocosphaera subtropica ATCC 51142]